MSTREDAKTFLVKLCSCMPRSCSNKLAATQRGYGFILDYLEQTDGEMSTRDFAEKLNVSPARITALLNKMEKNGFITRRTSSKDARRITIEITPAGIAFVDNMREQTLSKVEQLLNRLSKEDIETYIRISQQIKEAME